MRWVRRGLIFRADGRYPWMAHHASVPVVDRVSDDVLRIFFGPRDVEGRTRVAFIDVDADEPSRVLAVHDRPVLDLGQLGTFDDSGVMPSSIVNDGDRKYMLYIGWNRGVTVPYRNAVGLAVSLDGGLSFERVFAGPILDRTRDEPFFCASPYALLDSGVWRLWYASCTGFEVVGGQPEPRYKIKYAESPNGFDWYRPNITCIEYEHEGEANARPCVLHELGLYRMWYCHRGSVGYRTDPNASYRLGYAESADGIRWRRLDHLVGFERPTDGWDSIMQAYPYVIEHGDMKYMFYNGNGFGESGIGYAVLSEDDRDPRRPTNKTRREAD